MTARAGLVLGVGNDARGDDAVGREVARRLRARDASNIVVREAAPDGMLLVDAWTGADTVVIVDAMSSGLAPGSIRRFDAARPIPDYTRATSTHALGVPQAIELGRALGRLPDRLVVVGIEGACFDHGAGLSPPVEAALPGAVDRVLAEFPGCKERHSCTNSPS